MTAIEPEPIADLIELVDEYPDLEVVEETSLEALRHLPIADAIVLDGDHNYYTLSEELRLIAERAEAGSRCWSSTTSAGRSRAATSTPRRTGSRRSIATRTARTSSSFRGTRARPSAGCHSSGARWRRAAPATG